jgi:hypothetical protein
VGTLVLWSTPQKWAPDHAVTEYYLSYNMPRLAMVSGHGVLFTLTIQKFLCVPLFLVSFFVFFSYCLVSSEKSQQEKPVIEVDIPFRSIRVRGYQKFDITIPRDTSQSWDVKVYDHHRLYQKMNIVQDVVINAKRWIKHACHLQIPEDQVQVSFLDVGCSGGLLPLAASMAGAIDATGIDHDIEYTTLANAVFDLGFDTFGGSRNIFPGSKPKALNRKFSQSTHMRADVVSFFAVIHWLYGETDHFTNFLELIESMVRMARCVAIIQWVDPLDDGYQKWGHKHAYKRADNMTTMTAAAQEAYEYSETKFFETLGKLCVKVLDAGYEVGRDTRRTVACLKLTTPVEDNFITIDEREDIGDDNTLTSTAACESITGNNPSLIFEGGKKVTKKFSEKIYSLGALHREVYWLRVLNNYMRTKNRDKYNFPKLISVDIMEKSYTMENVGLKLSVRNFPWDWRQQLSEIYHHLLQVDCNHNDESLSNLVIDPESHRIAVIDFSWATHISDGDMTCAGLCFPAAADGYGTETFAPVVLENITRPRPTRRTFAEALSQLDTEAVLQLDEHVWMDTFTSFDSIFTTFQVRCSSYGSIASQMYHFCTSNLIPVDQCLSLRKNVNEAMAWTLLNDSFKRTNGLVKTLTRGVTEKSMIRLTIEIFSVLESLLYYCFKSVDESCTKTVKTIEEKIMNDLIDICTESMCVSASDCKLQKQEFCQHDMFRRAKESKRVFIVAKMLHAAKGTAAVPSNNKLENLLVREKIHQYGFDIDDTQMEHIADHFFEALIASVSVPADPLRQNRFPRDMHAMIIQECENINIDTEICFLHLATYLIDSYTSNLRVPLDVRYFTPTGKKESTFELTVPPYTESILGLLYRSTCEENYEQGIYRKDESCLSDVYTQNFIQACFSYMLQQIQIILANVQMLRGNKHEYKTAAFDDEKVNSKQFFASFHSMKMPAGIHRPLSTASPIHTSIIVLRNQGFGSVLRQIVMMKLIESPLVSPYLSSLSSAVSVELSLGVYCANQGPKRRTCAECYENYKECRGQCSLLKAATDGSYAGENSCVRKEVAVCKAVAGTTEKMKSTSTRLNALQNHFESLTLVPQTVGKGTVVRIFSLTKHT